MLNSDHLPKEIREELKALQEDFDDPKEVKYKHERYRPTGSMSANNKRVEVNKYYQGEPKASRPKVKIAPRRDKSTKRGRR